MTDTEHLLVCLMEEAAEVQQAASKCLRFGIDEHHPERNTTNGQELVKELTELFAIKQLLVESILPRISAKDSQVIIDAKQQRFLVYRGLSELLGRVQPKEGGGV